MSVLQVIRAVNKLNFIKHDGIFHLVSNGFKEGPAALCNHISVLFTGFIRFGHVASKIIICSMLPLINYTSSDICSFVEIHQGIIRHHSYKALSTSNRQFGFKRKHSTIECTWLVKETANYYKSINTNIFYILDYTKAFDWISFHTLFSTLSTACLPGVILRHMFIYLH